MRAKMYRDQIRRIDELEDAEIGVQHLYLRFAFRFQFFLIQLKIVVSPAFFHFIFSFLFLVCILSPSEKKNRFPLFPKNTHTHIH